MTDDTSEPGASGLASTNFPTNNLVRARIGAGVALRMEAGASGAEAPVLYGNFSEFNSWYEVNSLFEGHFMERVAPGAFAQTITRDRQNMRVLFDHGMDPSMGNKPLGPIRTLEEREDGAHYEVPLYDTDYNRDQILPLLRGRLMDGNEVGSGLGASFRFTSEDESWNRRPERSALNPNAIPERTILRATVYEFGPVTFPANPGATSGARSLSDLFMARLESDRKFAHRFQERVGKKVLDKILSDVPDELRQSMATAKADDERRSRIELLQRRGRALVVTS